jgi:uncharacterized protein (DUF697 family)
MAIVQNPITGRSKKSFGTAVFTKIFGKNVMRTKPLEVKNPRTEGQVNQRNKFATIVAIVKQLLILINEIYGKSLTNMTPANKVTSINVKNAFAGDPPVLDHTKLQLCDFEGSMVQGVVLAAQADQAMNITWAPGTVNDDELASKLTFVLFNCETNQAIIFRDVAVRQDGEATVNAPASWVGAQTALHVMTTDYNQLLDGNPKKIIKFQAGVDAASVVL